MLNYEELILLDSLIYLEWDVEEGYTIKDIVKGILNNNNTDKATKSIGNCAVKIHDNQWFEILNYINNNEKLSTLRITNFDTYKNGMEFACFVDKDNTAVVVFRGTSTSDEWKDNGEGAYEYETGEQMESLSFINSLKYDKITVTGHSKGGNKAQYVAVLSPKVYKCVSIDGQGFSKAFIEKYKNQISENSEKIISINAQYDYVSCLLNSISGRYHYIKTETQVNPFFYHEPHILLNGDGKLRMETSQSALSKILHEFSEYVILNLSDNMKRFVIDSVINIIELSLCRNVNTKNIYQVSGEFLLMSCYENFFEYEKIFNLGYIIVKILILPLLFWNDLIFIQETKSKENLNEIIGRIKILGDEIIKRMEFLYKKQSEIFKYYLSAIQNLTYKLENELL